MSEVLKVKDLSKSYNQTKALHSVDLSLYSGQILGLLGPNGAGKSTLIRIINNIITYDQGEVYLMGSALSQDALRDIGYLPEERGLYKKMTVQDQLVYLAKLRGLSRFDAIQNMNKWFEKLEITGWNYKPIESLSKGMQQKVQFISCLIHDPELIILDEPFSGFDPVNAEIIKREILALKKQGKSIVLSTHNMASVEELCDKIALINKGEIVLSGKVSTVKKKHSADHFSIEFKGEVSAFSNALWTGAKIVSFKQQEDSTKAIVKFTNHLSMNELIKSVIDKVEVIAFKEILPSMQDIFLRTIKPTQDA